jgi:energy-coupling factor transporter ATP-binding protein EcfA2
VHIDAVSIHGLRGIASGELEGMRPLVILTGPNGCGKSTFLDGLLLAGARYPDDALARVVARRPRLAMGARWLVHQGRAEGAVVGIRSGARDGGARLLVESKYQPGNIDVEAEARLATPITVASLFERLDSRGEGFLATAVIGSDNRSVRSGDQRSAPVVPGGIELVAMGWEPLHAAYGRVVRGGHKKAVLDFVALVLGAPCELEALPEEDGNSQLYVTLPGALPVPVATSGDGVAAGLQLAMELAASTADVLLVEEPEVHQHPSSMRALARVLVAAVKSEKQVIVTTQSLEMIDLLVAAAGDDLVEALSLYNLALREGKVVSARRLGADVKHARVDSELDLR